MFKRGFAVAAAAAVVCGLSMRASASAALYSDDFNWTGRRKQLQRQPDEDLRRNTASPDATFGYDYSALGIPSAPNTTDGSTKGLRLQVDSLINTSSSAVGAIEVATKGLSLPSVYTISVDVWGNYIGGTTINDANGSNGSTGPVLGLGTNGTRLQSIGGNDGALAETFNDNGGGTNLQYRMYTNNTHPLPNGGSSTVFAAGSGATSASNTDPYYSFMGTHTAPTVQSTASTTQTGTTPVGIIGFAWHTETLTEDGSNVIWAIDGHTITTTPNSAFTFGGGQIQIGNDDSNQSANATTNGQLYNDVIFDNLVITPEPASLGLLAMAAIPLFRRRKA